MKKTHYLNISDSKMQNLSEIYEEVIKLSNQEVMIIINIKSLSRLDSEIIEFLCYLKIKLTILNVNFFVLSTKRIKKYMENFNIICFENLKDINKNDSKN